MTDSVQVAVRLRPFIHAYEIDTKTRLPHAHVSKVVTIKQPTTIIRDPNSGKETQFTYDFSYDSFDSSSKNFASQETVWNDIGISVLDRAWEGYNVTLFAYGQTGSGKSYSMTGGSGDDEGIMPRASREIFKRIDANEDEELTYRVEVSMCEVYMEKIHDLFNPGVGGKSGLRVREHPKMGVYIEGLNAKLVEKYEDIEKWMAIGIGNRTKAATEMNADSSRAHTVLEVILTQQRLKKGSKKAQVKRSKINLVDLAGSERLGRTGAKGNTMKQGIAINQSLTNLGTVIMTLAKNSELEKPKPVSEKTKSLSKKIIVFVLKYCTYLYNYSFFVKKKPLTFFFLFNTLYIISKIKTPILQHFAFCNFTLRFFICVFLFVDFFEIGTVSKFKTNTSIKEFVGWQFENNHDSSNCTQQRQLRRNDRHVAVRQPCETN